MVLPPSARRPAWTFLSTAAEHPDGVDATVIEEALILDRDDRLDQVLRDPRQRNLDPLFLEDGEDRAIAGVEQRRGLRHVAEAAERLAVGQTGRQIVTEIGQPAGRAKPHDRKEHDGGDEQRGRPRAIA